jgi:hypothetical protein
MILSDGIHFWFAVAQLNTLAINIEIEGLKLKIKINFKIFTKRFQ